MKLLVDIKQRNAKMRAHTAAHLLHAELVKIFPATKQAGSFVDEDYLRFDFAADRPLNLQELNQIQININKLIYDCLPVEVVETSYEDSQKTGAKAFFEDKYGDVVRVVTVFADNKKSSKNKENISVELCGGTHISNTKDIGCFAILSQEAVASGIKRISAVVGPKVYEQIIEKDGLIESIATKLGVSAKQTTDKIDKMLKEYETIKASLEQMEFKSIADFLSKLNAKITKDVEKIFVIPSDLNFKNVINQAKNLFANQTVLLATKEGNFALLGNAISSAKKLAEKLGLKGGGSDQLVQGKDPNVEKLLD